MHATSSSPIALKVQAAREHSAVSSLGVCTTPALTRLWRALRSEAEGRHPTNLNIRGQASYKPKHLQPFTRAMTRPLERLLHNSKADDRTSRKEEPPEFINVWMKEKCVS